MRGPRRKPGLRLRPGSFVRSDAAGTSWRASARGAAYSTAHGYAPGCPAPAADASGPGSAMRQAGWTPPAPRRLHGMRARCPSWRSILPGGCPGGGPGRSSGDA
ncbi:hypothetical protein G6F50_018249 [Rhizopus delemar]|uniref:Uncharacterized protein n=1 Tax=Rhizopus delemar TaxID=936053 RepID=A0A9P6XMX6_9FUNG|nr:hypothetical protein G6F50_018249 [Rhizopus delemar]